jgi:autophagy-related protein 27
MKVVAIAGNLENAGGSQFEYELSRLKSSDSHSDSQKEGVLLVMKGGKHPLSGPSSGKRGQKAIIEFLCDKNKTGLEDEWNSEDEYDPVEDDEKLRLRNDGDDGDNEGDDGSESGVEHQLMKPDPALIWHSYGPEEGDVDVLRLTWHTKYACEDARDNDDGDDGDGKSGGWGFFTWFVIM